VGQFTLCRLSGQRCRRRWQFPLALGILAAGLALALACGRAGPAEPEGHYCAVDGRVAVSASATWPCLAWSPGGHWCRLHHRPAEPPRQCEHRDLGLQSAKAGLPGSQHRSCRHLGRRCWWWAHRGCEVAPDRSLPSHASSDTLLVDPCSAGVELLSDGRPSKGRARPVVPLRQGATNGRCRSTAEDQVPRIGPAPRLRAAVRPASERPRPRRRTPSPARPRASLARA